MGADPITFFLDEKVTKKKSNQQRGFFAHSPLPGKTDKTTGCIILPPVAFQRSRKRRFSRPQFQLVLSVFTRSFFADSLGRTNIFLLMSI
ncbi:hypothetical protein HK413_10425 [Mucilaginibacter sp. S1162]|uniref:Uncharacterized protein n=1 Tax=Mucilaginibacter humi TaxID=2732510 RepID=A0ABX1W3K3_9SPHI|nr:hypothetical protein [Mucilaginibacter humi]NNU34439.1 hypothetical protein [Mucilaginibacter humi]